MSRGGHSLDALIKEGAEPFVGSFDTGAGKLGAFFQDIEAAFLMVKTDWDNIDEHYPVVAQRFVDALRCSPVRLAVSLSAMGSDVKGKTGHFEQPDAAASVLEGLDEMFTITELGITGELARCLATTNVIESLNSVVRRVSGRVTNYKDAQMALRWTAASFIEAEKSFKKLRGHADLKILVNSLRPNSHSLKEAA